jgi:hypothetical protein
MTLYQRMAYFAKQNFFLSRVSSMGLHLLHNLVQGVNIVQHLDPGNDQHGG